ncbi:integrase domain-containing protein [Salmonella enterica]|uniref:integrase domain-containing protein n=1 Tax=Salmonella enterica TaxID=28901 RepID=UPI0009AD3212|nr:integrase domain-containing protein [Salmonella enterica]
MMERYDFQNCFPRGHKSVKLARQLNAALNLIGGKEKTLNSRRNTLVYFCGYVRDTETTLRNFRLATEDMIEGYIRYRENKGMHKRTLSNEMSVLRNIMDYFELYELKNSPRLTNTALGLTGVSRKVKKRPMPDIIYRITEDNLMEKENYFVVAIMKLCRGLGLRTDEAILGMASLTTWLKRVNADMPTVHIVFGNRVGNYRHTHIINRERVREALIFAINVWENEKGGKNGLNKRTFQKLKDYYQHHFSHNVAVKGYSSHSMRYAWAVEAFDYWISSGLSRKEALYIVKQSLGYGDGGGRSLKTLVSERIDQQTIDECVISSLVATEST